MDKGWKRPCPKGQALVGQTSIVHKEEVGPLYEPHGPGPAQWYNCQCGVDTSARRHDRHAVTINCEANTDTLLT
eukprot:11807287-Heterocapsa_arctica.AAC.1